MLFVFEKQHGVESSLLSTVPIQSSRSLSLVITAESGNRKRHTERSRLADGLQDWLFKYA
jgi:hypothetical protein